MIEEQDGWFVVNARDGNWLENTDFGRRCSFEKEGKFPQPGVGPCVVVMTGHRPAEHQLYYPEHPLAAKHLAQCAEPSADPRVAYAKASRWQHAEEPPAWPLQD